MQYLLYINSNVNAHLLTIINIVTNTCVFSTLPNLVCKCNISLYIFHIKCTFIELFLPFSVATALRNFYSLDFSYFISSAFKKWVSDM